MIISSLQEMELNFCPTRPHLDYGLCLNLASKEHNMEGGAGNNFTVETPGKHCLGR